MGEISCLDGSVLTLRVVPVLGRDDVPYEALLELDLDGARFGVVGERCYGVLLALSERGLVSSTESRMRAAGLEALWPYLPRDRELLALRARDPDDLPGEGSLRAVLDVRRTWRRSGWQIEEQVRLEAWGSSGRGVSAVLRPERFQSLVGALLQDIRDL